MPAPILPPPSQSPPGPPLAEVWGSFQPASDPPVQLQAGGSRGDGVTPISLPPEAPADVATHATQPTQAMQEGRARPTSRPPPMSESAPLPPMARQAALRPNTRPSTRPTATASEPVEELSGVLRWSVRVVLGVSLFVIVGTLRQCRALNDDIEQALARWEMRPSAHAGSSPRSSTTASPEALGPLASEWLRSDLHQVAGGDKDRVRGFVQRLEAAGAITIHVGTITDLGMTRIAGELLVVLPTEATRRAAVLEVHQSMLRATYGQFAPQSQPEGELLRVTL
jgi:hypothetical protein